MSLIDISPSMRLTSIGGWKVCLCAISPFDPSPHPSISPKPRPISDCPGPLWGKTWGYRKKATSTF